MSPFFSLFKCCCSVNSTVFEKLLVKFTVLWLRGYDNRDEFFPYGKKSYYLN